MLVRSKKPRFILFVRLQTNESDVVLKSGVIKNRISIRFCSHSVWMTQRKRFLPTDHSAAKVTTQFPINVMLMEEGRAENTSVAELRYGGTFDLENYPVC
jgi:hypothetical protein